MDVMADIRASKMSRLQIRAVAIAMMLIILDGFEIAVMAFVAKPMADAWNVSDSTTGLVLSASLFGMAAGAILFSPFGDRWGRRPLVVVSMAMLVAGMFAAALAPNVESLIAARFLTGLGIGAMSQLNAYVSEFASEKRKGTVVGIYATGFPIGATIAGLLATGLIDGAGWKSVFWVGGVLAAIALVISWIALPESMDFLMARRPKNALARVNENLVKMGRAPLTELPEITAEERVSGNPVEIFKGALGARTLTLYLGYACLMAAYYFANSWVPKLIAESTGDDTKGTMVGTVLSLGGIIGSLLFAVIAFKVIPRTILIWTLGLGAVGYATYGALFEVEAFAVGLGVVLGVAGVAAVAGFYAVAPAVYPAALRGTGVGWMVGVGRLVSITAPIGTGFLLDAGWAAGDLFYLMALPLAVGTGCIIVLAKLQNAAASRVLTPAQTSIKVSV